METDLKARFSFSRFGANNYYDRLYRPGDQNGGWLPIGWKVSARIKRHFRRGRSFCRVARTEANKASEAEDEEEEEVVEEGGQERRV